ncbi:predicted protein [Histoplasma capsulatum var. duboisii H88]|uniref:Predicted protein n=1 Tax=Ajellomyces capsulatus (strain H88) TaxID=544711 RepID=F0UN46_AJEC8|nr:predicted protein [Histoplasma capsulatum var. duboisii H88]
MATIEYGPKFGTLFNFADPRSTLRPVRSNGRWASSTLPLPIPPVTDRIRDSGPELRGCGGWLPDKFYETLSKAHGILSHPISLLISRTPTSLETKIPIMKAIPNKTANQFRFHLNVATLRPFFPGTSCRQNSMGSTVQERIMIDII